MRKAETADNATAIRHLTGIENNAARAWVVSHDGQHRRKVGRGDDPTWSPDGFVTRAFPDPKRGGPTVMIEAESGEKQLKIVPPKRNWGRFAWVPDVKR